MRTWSSDILVKLNAANYFAWGTSEASKGTFERLERNRVPALRKQSGYIFSRGRYDPLYTCNAEIWLDLGIV